MREAATQNAITFGQQDRANYGMTSCLSNKWFNDTLGAEVLAFVNFCRSSSYIRPLITYAFTDHLKATVGGKFYRGVDDTFLAASSVIRVFLRSCVIVFNTSFRLKHITPCLKMAAHLSTRAPQVA